VQLNARDSAPVEFECGPRIIRFNGRAVGYAKDVKLVVLEVDGTGSST
jgi:hypothetical protein